MGVSTSTCAEISSRESFLTLLLGKVNGLKIYDFVNLGLQ